MPAARRVASRAGEAEARTRRLTGGGCSSATCPARRRAWLLPSGGAAPTTRAGPGVRPARSLCRPRGPGVRRPGPPPPPGTRHPSPRTAAASQRDVPVLLRRQGLALGAQEAQRPDDLAAGLVRMDHRVDVAALGGEVRVGEMVLVLLDQLGARGF